MIFIYIKISDIHDFKKLVSDTYYDDIVVTYYNSMEASDLVMVSLSLNDYISLTDRNLLQKISLLQN